MKKIATALLLTVLASGSLMATDNVSFAATRHSGRPVSHKKMTAKKGKKNAKAFEESYKTARRTPGEKKIRRRGRKGAKNRGMPGSAPAPVVG
jgi:hypothetical protein